MNFLLLIIMIVIVYIPLIVLSIYVMILFIKIANRGIKALDIYIDKNERGLYETSLSGTNESTDNKL
jgi:cytochrome bd-type quinol oxidase subunit 1